MIQGFHKPKSIREAVALKKKFKDGAVFLAGGTFVNSKNFPSQHEHLICLEGLKLTRISGKGGATRGPNRSEITIEALCTLQQILGSKSVPQCLKAAVAQVTSRNIRNAATLGGHLASRKSCSDLIPTLIALGAKVGVTGSGKTRVMGIEEYLAMKPKDLKATLVTRIVLPKSPPQRTTVCRNFRESSNSTSSVTVAVSVIPSKSLIQEVVVAVGGQGWKTGRLFAVESELKGKPLPSDDSIDEIQTMIEAHLASSDCPLSCRRSCLAPCQCSRIATGYGKTPEYARYQVSAIVALALCEACKSKGIRQ